MVGIEEAMKETILGAALALTLTLPPAWADMSPTGNFGAWQTFAGTNDNGEKMCGASVRGKDRFFMIKYAGDNLVTLQLWKVGWAIPSGKRIKVDLQIDNAPLFHLIGVGTHVPGVDGVDISISEGEVWPETGINMIQELFAQLREGRKVRFSFPDGTEPWWEGNLNGSTAAIASVASCFATAPSAPTQPFGARPIQTGPATTQPFKQF